MHLNEKNVVPCDANHRVPNEKNLNGCEIQPNKETRQLAVQIIHHICECLMDLHAAGFAHRDLKPANIMWLPRQNRWTLIDFGCAAPIDSEAPTGTAASWKLGFSSCPIQTCLVHAWWQFLVHKKVFF
jgi:serine/threonine protein kinase